MEMEEIAFLTPDSHIESKIGSKFSTFCEINSVGDSAFSRHKLKSG